MYFLVLSVIALILQPVYGSPNFTTCFQDVLNRTSLNLQGLVDAKGNQVTDVTQAVGLTYQVCKTACGTGDEPFDWHGFSTQFTAWVLPCLALISQLPYGANDAFNNFEGMFLSVGSPMLAAYSLALAVISNRWMVQRFRRSDYPNSFFAARIMSRLQHVALKLPKDPFVLPSLIVRRENDIWWRRLDEGLDFGSQWTVAAILSMVYVAFAYAFTWTNRIDGMLNAQSSGWQSICSLWLSVLPVVICYLQVSPKTDSNRIKRELNNANQTIHVVTRDGQLVRRTDGRTIMLETECRDSVYEDVHCTTPICFYARVFSWLRAAQQVADAFDAASQNKYLKHTYDRNRLNVIERCTLPKDYHSPRPFDIYNVFIVATLLAFFLQWGITGAAFMTQYLTPTQGLSCHSGSHLLYGSLATFIWLLAVFSSASAHSYETSLSDGHRTCAGSIAIATRYLAKILAGINAAWILLLSLFQFSNMYDSCYCNSSALGLGHKAYVLLEFTNDEQTATKLYWIGGMLMASGTSLFFIIAINLLKKEPESRIVARVIG